MIFMSFYGMAQWGLGVDAGPFLSYSGNLLGGNSQIPNWSASEGLNNGIDLYRKRPKKNDWLRYRLSIRFSTSIEDESVILLDENLVEIDEETGFDRTKNTALDMTVGIEKEKWIGEKKLKGIMGRGISISMTSQNYRRTVQNPLGAYISDTLWYDSGHSFSGALYMQTGILYPLSENLVISSRLGYGVSMSYIPDSQYRAVEMINDLAELVQHIERPSEASWSIDTFIRPQITLIFYFDNQLF